LKFVGSTRKKEKKVGLFPSRMFNVNFSMASHFAASACKGCHMARRGYEQAKG